MLILRFDFRLGPEATSTMADLYATALDMAEWADTNGAASVLFSEHHASSDGYLPSPLVLAAAAAARTSTVPISIGALLLLMYDPIKLAEDLVVLDHVSQGRASYVIGLGYRAEEYKMFGVDPTRRGALIDERLDVLRRAWSGERFEWDGRSVRVTPEPFTPGGPSLAYGGGSAAAARRAARHGLMFLPQSSDPSLAEAYDEEAERVGNPTGMTLAPPPGAPTSVFVADDVDRAWHLIGPHLLHDARMYAAWMGEVGADSASMSAASTVEDLRAENGSYRIVTPPEAIDLVATHGMLSTQPLCGGIPPDEAWESLRLIEHQVLPALA
jgi:alkanesulfonate monooxygenase SsuD/methylene tetrahydromethanopterin reductase-like flavin-dependent oxidoreductase (luciferase family)